MERSELTELHYIIHINNLPSIRRHGIVCNRASRALNGVSVAMPEVQDKRSVKRIPGGKMLHEYVNLYINARNPMLYKRLNFHERICVLSVHPSVVDWDGVVVTDQNAASDWVRYGAGAAGLSIVDRSRTFSQSWKHSEDQREEWRHKSAMCAEVLVPVSIPINYVSGVYVSNEVAKANVVALNDGWKPIVHSRLFFR